MCCYSCNKWTRSDAENVMMNTDGEREMIVGKQEKEDANVKGCDNDSLTHLIYDPILYLRATHHSNERYIISFLPTISFLLIHLSME